MTDPDVRAIPPEPGRADLTSGSRESTADDTPLGSNEPVGNREPAGHGGAVERLRASAATLDDLDERPVADHAARYEAVHDELQTALRDIDDQPG